MPLIAAISMLALTGAAAAAPVPATHTTWMAGRIERVDLDHHAVVIAHGSRHLTLTLAAHAEIREGHHALNAQSLAHEVGRSVKVRFTNGAKGRVADMVEVVPPAKPHHAAARH
ncbi:MAG: hypothetical protein U0P30_04465 [Vicinamibacterales bacterium]